MDAYAGQVYLLKAENGLYKIGFSRKLDERMHAIKKAIPMKLELVYHHYRRFGQEAELELHRFFTNKRVQGEWFTLDDEDVQYFKDYFTSEVIDATQL